MPKSLWLIAVGAALAAAPAAAQIEAADDAVHSSINETATSDVSVATDANLVAAPPAANALEPAPPLESDLAADTVDDDRDERRGFPWGLLGLAGLVGLLGRRRTD